MPLDNDMCDVKMPSLEGKAWAGANGDWATYIGSNYEWELVNVYTRDRVPLPNISAYCPEVEQYTSSQTTKDGNKLVEDSNNLIVVVIPRAVGNSTNCYLS